MGVYAGPEITSDGLVLALDAANIKSNDRYENLFTYSIFEQGLFTRNGGTFTANATTAPDGTNTASLVTPTSSSAYYGWYPNSSYTFIDGVARLSFYAKANGYNWVGVKSGLGTPWSYSAAGYNLSTGQTFTYDLGTNGYQFISADNVGNGWYRIVIGIRGSSLTSGQQMNIGVWSDMPSQHTGVWNGNGTSGAYFWGAQLEKGSVANNYYPTSGTAKTSTLIDLSGRGITGTLTNGPTYSSANGGSIVFDGTNDYIEIPNNNLYKFSNTQAFSLNLWVRCTATSGAPVMFAFALTSGRGYYFTIDVNLLRTNAFFFDYWDGSSYRGIQGNNNSITMNTWVMLTATSSTNSVNDMKVYQNSVLTSYTNRGTGIPNTIDYNTLSMKIGARGDGGYFTGNIAQVSIYNRALSATEISQNFNATKSRYGL